MNIKSYKVEGKLISILKEVNELTDLEAFNPTFISVDDGCYDFMFMNSGTLNIEYGGKYSINVSSACFSHQFPPPLKFCFKATSSFFSVKVQPWMNSFFFPQFSTDSVLNCSSFIDAKILTKELKGLRTFDEKINDTLKHFEDVNLTDDQVFTRKICEIIYDRLGMISVSELASQIRLDRHRLNSRFIKEVKYSLKSFMRIVRINALLKDKIKNSEKTFSDLAHTYGYFDQAHFIYDFRKLTGTTPTKFFKNLPLFQHRHR